MSTSSLKNVARLQLIRVFHNMSVCITVHHSVHTTDEQDIRIIKYVRKRVT